MAAVNMELAGQVAALVRELMDTWRTHRSRNMLREDYYLGHVGVKDLGIAMPKALAKKINPRVDWPKKAVHALADRSVFNGFTADTDGGGKPIISAYPATAAAAIWDDAQKRIKAGLVVAESKKMPGDTERVPTVLHLLTEDALVVLTRGSGHWVADYMEHGMGRCLMEPMPYDATLERPFGSSRISRSVMSITDAAIRQRARMEV